MKGLLLPFFTHRLSKESSPPPHQSLFQLKYRHHHPLTIYSFFPLPSLCSQKILKRYDQKLFWQAPPFFSQLTFYSLSEAFLVLIQKSQNELIWLQMVKNYAQKAKSVFLLQLQLVSPYYSSPTSDWWDLSRNYYRISK